MRGLCHQAGLKIASVYSRAQWTLPISHPDDEIREAGRQVLLELIRAAEMLHCEAVLVIPGWVDNQVISPEQRIIIPYGDALAHARGVLESVVHHADKRGVDLCLENVPGKLHLDPLSFRDFVGSFPSERVGAYFDIANCLNYGFPEHWIPEIGPFIRRLHVKDARPSLWPTNAVVNLFEGEVNWPEVIRQLAATDYDGWLTAEVLPVRLDYPERFLARLREDLGFLRSQIQRERRNLRRRQARAERAPDA